MFGSASVLRAEFVHRKLQLIAEDLGRLLEFKDASYDELVIDHRIVHEAIGTALEQFTDYVEAVGRFVDARAPESG